MHLLADPGFDHWPIRGRLGVGVCKFPAAKRENILIGTTVLPPMRVAKHSSGNLA